MLLNAGHADCVTRAAANIQDGDVVGDRAAVRQVNKVLVSFNAHNLLLDVLSVASGSQRLQLDLNLFWRVKLCTDKILR